MLCTINPCAHCHFDRREKSCGYENNQDPSLSFGMTPCIPCIPFIPVKMSYGFSPWNLDHETWNCFWRLPMKRLFFVLFTVSMLHSSLCIPTACAAARFIDCYDGTVLDTQSNLLWVKNANCFGTKNWDDAITVSSSLAHGQCALSDGSQVGDWHLPTVDELRFFTDGGIKYIGYKSLFLRIFSHLGTGHLLVSRAPATTPG